MKRGPDPDGDGVLVISPTPSGSLLAGGSWMIRLDGVEALRLAPKDAIGPERLAKVLALADKWLVPVPPEDTVFHAETTTDALLNWLLLLPLDAPPLDASTCECFGLRTVSHDCKSCDGEGEVDCECPECGHDHRTECTACDGDGCTEAPTECPLAHEVVANVKMVRFGVIINMDRKLMARIVAMAPAGAAVTLTVRRSKLSPEKASADYRPEDFDHILGVGDGFAFLVMVYRSLFHDKAADRIWPS